MKTTDYKVSHQQNLKAKYGEKHYLASITGKPVEIQNIPYKIRVCEIGLATCDGNAYRRINSRYGLRWTCDKCAKQLCLESEAFISRNLNIRPEYA